MSHMPFSRRQALAAFAQLLAASPALRAQEKPQLRGEAPGRIAPHGELVNTFEFAAMAQRKLGSETFAAIADGDRAAFDRITFRQRLMVNTTTLDLTTDLFGDSHFAPILIGPASNQRRFHPDGELAMARGAAAAKATMVVADQSDYTVDKIVGTVDKIVGETGADLWYQVYPGADVDAVIGKVRHAVSVGYKAVCLTVGVPYKGSGANPGLDWEYVDRIRQATDAPLVLKGVMNADEAQQTAENGLAGIIVSNHGGRLVPGLADPITVLPSITEAVDGKIPVLIDGGIRRGSDVLKALALGASAALIARPALWALAAYGSDGVQSLLEMLQTELGNDMTMLGTVNPAAVTRSHVRIHRR